MPNVSKYHYFKECYTESFPNNPCLKNPKMTTRYYLHGDKHETDTGNYYCALCDAFVEPQHFDEPEHQKDAEARFRATEATLSALKTQKGTRYVRPNNAANVLLPFPQKPSDKIGRFCKWLERQVKRDDPIGDLAQDSLCDASFPKESEARGVLRKYLEANQACTETLVALDEALAEFHTLRRARRGISPKVRFEVFKRDEYRCKICGASALDGVHLEVDHIHPVAKGGTSETKNLQTLCRACNRGKGVSTL